jgi:hypothetical protein
MNVQQSLNDWIPTVQGQYINMDGAYGAQCWDLAAHWCATLGLPVINTGGPGRWPGWAGNMVDAFPQSGEINAAWELVGPDDTGLPGDIVVWGDSYYYYPATHVAVLVSDKVGNLLCMSQNSTPSVAGNPYPGWSTGPTTLQYLPRQGLIGFIRPRTGIGYQGNTTPAPTQDWFDMADENTLKNALRSVLTEPAVLDMIAMAILKRDCHLVDPSGRTGDITGTTSLAKKINWMAHNDAQILNAIVEVSKKLDVTHPVIPAETETPEEPHA